ncbi:hypothetical protein [Moorena sp. SIO3A2]|uniref:hypothetical protein n=1 Tax=Moorena sp. SIO3A2 TaxID=2607841 RepID=UPI0013BB43C9|nr:hypothetical protein [Moorena sp. SIO3A2]NER90355.1 hypothetical protein [Moorena sp. SIO3A2]
MVDSKLSINISARDNTSKAFDSVEASVRGLQSQITNLRKQTQGTGTAIERAAGTGDSAVLRGINNLFRMQTAFQVLDATIGVVRTSFGFLNDAISSAIDREVAQTQLLNTVIDTMGLSAERARAFTQGLNREISTLGKSLPVSSESINEFTRSIFDDFALAGRQEGLSPEAIRTATVTAASRLALAQRFAGTTPQQSQIAISALLSGSLSPAGLNQYKFFTENLRLRKELTDRLLRTGATSFKDLSEVDRVRVLTASLEGAFPEASIERLRQTSQATIAAFTDTLFDPEIGIFSISRDLDSSAPGYQSVMTSFKKTLDIVIGPTGILAQLGQLSGLSDDAFGLALRGVVDEVNALLISLKDSIRGRTSFGIGLAVGRFAAELVNNMVGGLARVNWLAFGKGLLGGLVGFVINLDWRIYLGAAVAAGLVAAAPSIVAGLATVVGGSILAAVTGLPAALIAAVGFAILGLVALIRQNWDSITGVIGEKLGQLRDYISSSIEAIIENFTRLIPSAPGSTEDALGFKLSPQSLNTAPPVSRQSTVNLGGINLNLAEGTSPNVAQEVLQILEDQVTQRLEASLAT